MVQDEAGPPDMPAHGVSDEENSRMQVIFDQAMCKAMEIPEGYQNVAVLIIKWIEELDQVKSASEVKELEQLFSQEFRFSTKVVELHNKIKPQKQLNSAVMDFVTKHDGPHNLSIVYYTGHASSHEESTLLELHASECQTDTSKGDYHASAYWNPAERTMIDDGEGDMVGIFDTCFASNLYKNTRPEDCRTYELLTASGHGRTTAGPGPKSFTTALMSSLKELLREYKDRPFTIRQLCEKINLQPTRKKNPSHVWSRLNRYDRNIALARLTRTPAEREQDFTLAQTHALLFLRFSLTVERLTDEQIHRIARALSKAVKDTSKTSVKRIDWWKLQSVGPMRPTIRIAELVRVVGSAVKWKNLTLYNRDSQCQPPVTTWNEPVQTIDNQHPHPIQESTLFGPLVVEPASPATQPPHISHSRKNSAGYSRPASPQAKRKS